MCPICLSSLAITIATTTGAGAVATACAVRVARVFTKNQEPKNREECHEHVENNRQP